MIISLSVELASQRFLVVVDSEVSQVVHDVAVDQILVGALRVFTVGCTTNLVIGVELVVEDLGCWMSEAPFVGR